MTVATAAPPATPGNPRLVESPLLPPGFSVPESRWTNPSTRMRQLLEAGAAGAVKAASAQRCSLSD